MNSHFSNEIMALPVRPCITYYDESHQSDIYHFRAVNVALPMVVSWPVFTVNHSIGFMHTIKPSPVLQA